jgi:hypothetical protein
MVLNGTEHLAKKIRAEEEDPGPSFDIFKSPDRDFLIDCKGNKKPIADLKNKIVGVYFSAHWCPPYVPCTTHPPRSRALITHTVRQCPRANTVLVRCPFALSPSPKTGVVSSLPNWLTFTMSCKWTRICLLRWCSCRPIRMRWRSTRTLGRCRGSPSPSPTRSDAKNSNAALRLRAIP